ncbi:UNVERIFIED_CONTAM: hypothetical protein FKN15_074295 [Acipenser sinensis]
MDLLNCISERSLGDSVAQSPAEILTPEGNETILICQYNTTDSSPDLYWYKQNPEESPEYIQHTSQYLSDPSSEFPARFSAELNPSSRTVPLRIQQCELTDSAVYYCALRTTVTGTLHLALQQPPAALCTSALYWKCECFKLWQAAVMFKF